MKMFACAMVGCLMAACVAAAMAAEPASTAPSDAASTRPVKYHVAVIPAGFHILPVGDHTIVCQPADDAWVRSALTGFAPVTRPSTMPSDLMADIDQHRAEMIRQAAADLALSNPKMIDDLIDQQILPVLKQLQLIKPPAFFFVVSRPALVRLMQQGWTDPRYHYLRVDQDVSYTPTVTLAVDNRADDLMIWVEIQDGGPSAANRDKLLSEIRDFDSGYAESLSELAQAGVGNVMGQFIRDHITTPLKLGPAVQWFGDGVAVMYSVKYQAMLIGRSRTNDAARVAFGNYRNPLHSQPLNLVEPLDPSIMRPELAPFYKEALFHKGASVVRAWIAKGGDGVLAKSLPALRAKPPTTPQELIAVIQQTTGIDLTPAMEPNYEDGLPRL